MGVKVGTVNKVYEHLDGFVCFATHKKFAEVFLPAEPSQAPVRAVPAGYKQYELTSHAKTIWVHHCDPNGNGIAGSKLEMPGRLTIPDIPDQQPWIIKGHSKVVEHLGGHVFFPKHLEFDSLFQTT